MADGFIRLDNPAFRGNLRTYRKRSNVIGYSRDRSSSRLLSDIAEPAARSRKVEPLPYPKTATAHTRGVPAEPAALKAVQPVQPEIAKRKAQPAPNQKSLKHNVLAKLRRSNTWLRSKIPKPIKRFKNKIMALWQHVPLPDYALPIIAVVLFLVGGGVIFQGLKTNNGVKIQAEQLVAGNAAAEGSFEADGEVRAVPDERPPDTRTYGSYSVAPDLPRFLRIQRFGVRARVVREGVLPNGEVNTPASIFDVGWYEGSAKPGEPGASLIVGHVSGPTTHGSLYNLKNLNTGDTVEVERGDGQKLTYVVVDKETQTYQDLDMAKALKSQNPDKPGLNLITCTGRYDARLHIFEKRVIVYTVLQ